MAALCGDNLLLIPISIVECLPSHWLKIEVDTTGLHGFCPGTLAPEYRGLLPKTNPENSARCPHTPHLGGKLTTLLNAGHHHITIVAVSTTLRLRIQLNADHVLDKNRE